MRLKSAAFSRAEPLKRLRFSAEVHMPQSQEAKSKTNLRSDIMATSANAANITNRGLARSIFRWIHLVLSIPILGYIYSPFEKLPDYAPLTRYVFIPLMVLSDFGCGKAMPFDDLFRRDLPSKVRQPTLSRPLKNTAPGFEGHAFEPCG